MKKVGLLYFTGTGGTARIAREITAGFESLYLKTEVFRVKKNITVEVPSIYRTLDGCFIIGIGSPTYGPGAPSLLLKFLKKVASFLRPRPYFIFVTAQGNNIGNTAFEIYRIFSRKKWLLLDIFTARAPDNRRDKMPGGYGSSRLYIPQSDITEAGRFPSRILAVLEDLYFRKTEVRKNSLVDVPRKFGGRIKRLIFGIFGRRIGRKKVNTDRCTRCGYCWDIICPSGALYSDPRTGYPAFRERQCIGCNGCVNLCPNDAVYTRKTLYRKQYDTYREYVTA